MLDRYLSNMSMNKKIKIVNHKKWELNEWGFLSFNFKAIIFKALVARFHSVFLCYEEERQGTLKTTIKK